MEMFIVITIMGILATVIFSQYDKYKGRSRDANRTIILWQYRSDLELYARWVGSGKYPASVPSTCMLEALASYPKFYEIRGGTGKLLQDPKKDQTPIAPCNQLWNFYYRSITGTNMFGEEIQVWVVMASRMELPGMANFWTGSELSTINDANYQAMIQNHITDKPVIPKEAQDYIYAVIVKNQK